MSNYLVWIKQNPGTIFKWALFLVLIYFPLCIDLDVLPIRMWDEARLAESASEMNKYGHYLTPTINGMADMWSVKPPLMIWLQVICMKIVGVNELAVRLPSALAGLLTCLLMMFFCIKYLKDFWWGFAASLVLVTSHGYVWMHAERSGDYDALLTLFITFYSICFYVYTLEKKTKFLVLTGAGIILAALTKGIAGMLFIPALFAFALFKGVIPSILKNRALYVNILAFIVIIGGYYTLREHYTPGYLKLVWQDEIGGRYSTVIEGHTGGFWYYFNNFISYTFNYWIILLPLGFIVGITGKNIRHKDFIIYSGLLVVFYFLIISAGKSKEPWYDLPLYPFMALIIACFLASLFQLSTESKNMGLIKPVYFRYILMWAIFFHPYQQIIYETYKPFDEKFFLTEDYLKQAIETNKNINNYYLYAVGYDVQFRFYTNILNDKHILVNYTDSLNFTAGDKVIINLDHQTELINKYRCMPIDSLGTLKVYAVLGEK